MFENIMNFFKKVSKKQNSNSSSKDTAKERLHLVLMQDRANVSADFLDLMRQEIIDVIKKYIDVDENAIDVRLTNKENEDGTTGAPALYANIPILNIKEEARKEEGKLAKAKKEAEKKSAKAESTPKNTKGSSNEKKSNSKPEVKKEDKKAASETKKDDKPKNEKEANKDEVKKEDKSQEKPKENSKQAVNKDDKKAENKVNQKD